MQALGRMPDERLSPSRLGRWGFFDMFYGLQAQATADVLTRLPASLPLQERGALLFEFETGRSFMFYTFCPTLACFSVPPLLVCGAAHHDHDVARRCIQLCVVSDHHHPRVQELTTEPARSEALNFVNGGDLDDCSNLLAVICKFRFGHAAERRCEGGHASINR